MTNPTRVKLARFISFAGHPLLTFSVFVLFITFKLYPIEKASFISSLVIGGVAFPIAISNYFKTKRGHYTNFDVSDRKQRESFYPFLIALLSIVTAVLFLTRQPLAFSSGSAVFLALIIVSWFVNRTLKCSLHTSISFFLAFALMLLNIPVGIILFVFAFLVAWSRLVLTRHTLAEVIAGGVTGIAFGVTNFFLQTHVLNSQGNTISLLSTLF